MSDPFEHRPLPRSVLLGAGALVAASLLAVSLGRSMEVGTLRTPEAEPAQSRDLLFEDRSDGAILVYDSGSDRPMEVLEPGTYGFVRGVMRMVARERRIQGSDRSHPVRLTLWDDGRLTLEDPTTAYQVALEAFGPTNAGAFARLLVAPQAEN